MRKVALIASDFLPSKLARGLAEKLKDQFACTTLLGDGKIPFPISPEEIRTTIEQSDIVLIGSSDHSTPEWCAGEVARELQKPLVRLALDYNQVAREEYLSLAPDLVFVVDHEEARTAQYVYPNAKVVVTGNPEWETFSYPTRGRNAVRQILNIGQKEKLVLISGEKEVGINMPLAVNVIEAVASLFRDDIKIIFAIHPGHVPLLNGGDLLQFYQELERYVPNVSVRCSCKTTPFGIGTPDMVSGADVVIGTNSTVQIQAAFLEIPSIAILLRRAIRGIDLPREQKGWWTPCDAGAIAPVYGLSSALTAHWIATLLTEEGAAPMKTAQRRLFPAHPLGEAWETMRDALLAL